MSVNPPASLPLVGVMAVRVGGGATEAEPLEEEVETTESGVGDDEGEDVDGSSAADDDDVDGDSGDGEGDAVDPCGDAIDSRVSSANSPVIRHPLAPKSNDPNVSVATNICLEQTSAMPLCDKTNDRIDLSRKLHIRATKLFSHRNT